jgi:hypothetical protein
MTVVGDSEMRMFELKNVFPPSRKCPRCGKPFRSRHLIVSAANEEEAFLMRSYLLNEGFEG